jgi:hypothetical protein
MLGTFFDCHRAYCRSEEEKVLTAPFSLTRPTQLDPNRLCRSILAATSATTQYPVLPSNATLFAPQSASLQPPTSSFPTSYLNAEGDRACRTQAASDMPPSPGNPQQHLTMMMMKACFLAALTKRDQMLLDLAVKYALVTTITQVLPSLPTYPPPANSLGGEENAHAAAHSAPPSSNPNTLGTLTAAGTTLATPDTGKGANADTTSPRTLLTHAPSTLTSNSLRRRAPCVVNPDLPSPKPVIEIIASSPRLGQTVDNSLPPLLSLSRDQ